VQLHDPKYSNLCTIKSCAFAGQNYLVTGSDDWNIYVWKMPTKWEQNDDNDEEMVVDHAYTVLKGHRSIVNHVKFGERSNLLLSCGVEKIIKVVF
jgi:WD repeat-containing protein 22